MVQPTIIIHLAGISSAQYAFAHPIEALNVNGMVVANICEIIYRNKWNIKLFNSSSSEMYKGYITHRVKEDENDYIMYYNHPYAIAKTMVHNMVSFYRDTYGLPFSNGIFFTIESPNKRPEFLLNKVAMHAIRWRKTKEPLTFGKLDSWRNILHAKDAARAIRKIIEQPKGNTYSICNDESELISTLVFKMYKLAGINVVAKEEGLYEIDTNLPVAFIKITAAGLDTQPIDIRGEPGKLKQIGWKPTFSIDDILNDIISHYENRE